MATLFDSGVWLALTFPSHPHHSLALAAQAGATAKDPACFCRATQQSFLRLATTPAILKANRAQGLTNRDALQLVTTLMQHPAIGFLDEPPGIEALWHSLACLDSASPKVWMDAYLAAFAIRRNTGFVTLDRDFQKFEKHGLDLRLLSLPG